MQEPPAEMIGKGFRTGLFSLPPSPRLDLPPPIARHSAGTPAFLRGGVMATTSLPIHAPDADLWQEVRRGGVLAFETLVSRYQSLVSAVAFNACGDLALSEDVAQETF